MDKNKEIFPIVESNLEQVDLATFEWLDNFMNIHCETTEGFKKVPVIWTSAERAFQIKNNKELRDERGALIYPQITIERSAVNKSNDAKGAFYNSLPENFNIYYVEPVINHKKTKEFANADSRKRYFQNNEYTKNVINKNNKVVYSIRSVLRPIYVEMTYNINLMSQYQQQMNQMVQPFITKSGSQKYFPITRDSRLFEGFIDANIQQKNNVDNLDNEERRYNSTITLKVFGHLVGDDINQNSPTVKIRENAVKISLPRETVILGEE